MGLLALPAVGICQNAPLACEGRPATVRVSEVKATGTKAGFLAAVAAHQAWFAGKGVGDIVFAEPLIVRDEKTKARSYSDKVYMTFHIRTPGTAAPKHDEAYAAFVKLYQENSEIKSEYDICLPNYDKK